MKGKGKREKRLPRRQNIQREKFIKGGRVSKGENL